MKTKEKKPIVEREYEPILICSNCGHDFQNKSGRLVVPGEVVFCPVCKPKY